MNSMNQVATLEALLIHRHVPVVELQAKCSTPLRTLQRHQHGWVFNSAIDPVELGLPDYFDIITKPMDLGTIQTKLEAGKYKCIEDFASDVNLVFDNAMTYYNEPGSFIHDMALGLQQQFHADYAGMRAQMVQEYGRRQDVARLVKQLPVSTTAMPIKRKGASQRGGGSGVVASKKTTPAAVSSNNGDHDAALVLLSMHPDANDVFGNG